MKHLDASFKHTLDLIRVKNNSVVLSIFDAIQDSSKYRFADDGASLVILNVAVELEISKLYEMPVFSWLFEICSFRCIVFAKNVGLLIVDILFFYSFLESND